MGFPFFKTLFMENQPKSTLEIKIQRFITEYGAEELIDYLDDFENIWSKKEFDDFRRLKKYACEAYGITIADMKILTIGTTTNAKRIISFIAFHSIKLPIAKIAKLLGNMAERSVYKYIKDAEDWLAVPKANREFYDRYISVLDKFNRK